MNHLGHRIGLFACLGLAGLASRRALAGAWTLGTRRPVPKNPASPGISWKEAMLWGAATGLVAGVVRTAVRRGYADVAGEAVDSEA